MDYEYKLGPAGGIVLGYNWHQNFGAQIELNYALMGQDYSDMVRDFSASYNPDIPNQLYPVLTYRYVDLNYIQVPMLFKYGRWCKDAIKYHILGGIQLSYLLSANQQYTADVYEKDEQVDIAQGFAPQSYVPDFDNAGGLTPQIDYFNRVDLGVLFDIGVDIYVNDKMYFLQDWEDHLDFWTSIQNLQENLNRLKGKMFIKVLTMHLLVLLLELISWCRMWNLATQRNK